MRPNRGTFLTALSALANSGGGGGGARGGEGDGADGRGEGDDVDSAAFSADEARVWIDRMEGMANRFDDAALRPDTEVYNAPLRWSGAPWGRAEGGGYAFPWDDYAAIFQDGFRRTDTSRNDAADRLAAGARNAERWLLDMERTSAEEDGRGSDAAPDVETYESVIQAWVRTGTLEGLLRAESWAMRSVAAAAAAASSAGAAGGDDRTTTTDRGRRSGAAAPRLQTFHPIVSAWANCGNERGPERVREWMERLQQLSESPSMAGLRPDGRMRAAAVLAWRKFQAALLNGSRSREDPRRERGGDDGHAKRVGSERGFDVAAAATFDGDGKEPLETEAESAPSLPEASMSAAKSCMECLERHCSEWHHVIGRDNAAFFLDGATFAHAINAWGDAAAVCAAREGTFTEEREREQGEFSARHALSEMLRVVQLFDDAVDAYKESSDRAAQRNDGKEYVDVVTNKNSLQLRHFMQISHKVYCNAVEHIRAVDALERTDKVVRDSSQDFSHRASYFMTFFPRIEMMLRRSTEFDMATDHLKSSLHIGTADDIAKGPAYKFDGCFDAVEFQYDDLFSYEGKKQFAFPGSRDPNEANEASANRIEHHNLYSEILKGCQNLDSLSYCGDAVRATMFIMDCIDPSRVPVRWHSVHPDEKTEDLTDLYVQIIRVIGSVVSNPHERRLLLTRVYASARSSSGGVAGLHHQPPLKVDIHSIIGALKDYDAADTLPNDIQLRRKSLLGKRRRFVRRRYRTRSKSW